MNYEEFPLRTYDKLRYRDTDRQGHVNNALFSTFLETGRVEFLYQDVPLHKDGCQFVIVNQTLDLVGEIVWPGTVEIGTMVTHVGSSSIKLYQELFQNEKAVARATTVIVQMNEQTHQSEALSDETRLTLTQYSDTKKEV